ncbi:MAG: hypothetical protein H0X24_01185 [Ktedonobacterales bacterium]|nr:hypothetical protein [Ktedonobacterales bacterium]
MSHPDCQLAEMPAPMNLRQACAYLARLRVPSSHADALERLTRWRDSLTLLALYQTNFPTEFAHSQADLLAEPEDPFGPREREFFNLVERHLFYFNQDGYIETCADAWSLAFPIPKLGVEICMCSDTFAQHSLGWQLLLLLAGYTSATTEDLDVAPEVRAVLAPLLDAPLPPGRLDWQRFTDLSLAHPTLGQRLIDAMTVLDRSTGNLYLDQECCDDYEEAFWSQEWIDRLTRVFAEAEAIMADADAFVDWLAADPVSCMQEVTTIWYAAFQSHP